MYQLPTEIVPSLRYQSLGVEILICQKHGHSALVPDITCMGCWGGDCPLPVRRGAEELQPPPPPHPGPDTHIDPHVDVALTQIVQDAGLIQESHISHVASLVEFGMVRLLDIIFLHDEHLGVKTQHMHQDIVLSHHHGGIGQSTTHSLALCKKLDQWVQLLVQPCPIELGWGGTSTAL